MKQNSNKRLPNCTGICYLRNSFGTFINFEDKYFLLVKEDGGLLDGKSIKESKYSKAGWNIMERYPNTIKKVLGTDDGFNLNILKNTLRMAVCDSLPNVPDFFSKN